MTFQRGKFSAILGPNGSSKSLLIEAIGGLYPVTSGRIITCDVDVTRSTASELATLRATDVAFVFSRHNIVETLSIEENLLLAHTISSLPVNEDLLDDVITSFNLQSYLAMNPMEVTADVLQRIAIARAVLKESQLILAQEPTQFLRHESSEMILDSLRRSCREYGISIIMSTHSNFVASYADHVHLFLDGEPTGMIVNPSLHSLSYAQENTATRTS
ncbi:ATP-binding cassette domain-containing protein [Arcanobacterium buesumense]|uniref:ATP-binding cassette domain-containing protein n=2 Tax=Arcanobacterium buesumense TaxID=2722751 RepID=A0A6H2EKB4_9ACTO|nr:ATP-binding cassette domain-containing protein [Arcanobacterium buesumense]